jgi:hypothetical protein
MTTNSRIHLYSASGRRTVRFWAFLCGLLLLPLPIRDVARGASQASRREALEWLLEAGGDAVIREKGMHPKPVTRGQRLPRRPFDVQRIVVEKWLRPVRPEELQCLAALDETESLALYHLPAGCGLGFLRDWRGLENLSLYYADFGDDVLGDLEGLSSLKELLIRYNRNFTGSGLERLAGLKNLEALDLELTGLTEETRPVFTAFPRLQTLSLSKNRVGEAAAEEAARLVFLRRLNLSGASLTGEALRAGSRATRGWKPRPWTWTRRRRFPPPAPWIFYRSGARVSARRISGQFRCRIWRRWSCTARAFRACLSSIPDSSST